MRYLVLILLILGLAACDNTTIPTPTPTLPSVPAPPTMTALLKPTLPPPTPLKPALIVPPPARRYAVTVDDLLVGYQLSGQEEGLNFYSSRYEKDDKFRKFEQTIYVLDSPDAATQQMPSLLSIFTATLTERTSQPLTEADEQIGDVTLMRQYQWGNVGSKRGAIDLAFRYQNAVAFISYTYDVAQMPDAEAAQRARGLLAIILGKMISK